MVAYVHVVAVIAFLYGALAEQLPSQCFNYQTVPGNRDRSRYNNVSDPNSAPCDNIADGSYRFQSGEISTSCVPVHHCGTVSTIWMKDPIPDVGTTSYNEFCVNHKSSSSNGDPCCLFSFRVNVSNCHGFLVYDFRSDDVLCPSGYCTEKITACAPGMSSATGFSPCPESYPVMMAPPTLEAPVLSANGEDFSQNCVIHHNGSRAEFKVTWLFDGKEYKTRILSNGTTQDSITAADWVGHVGQHLRCQVTSYFQYSQAAYHSPPLDSNSFFGGIVVPPTPITVEEDNQREVTLVSTLPVICENTPKDKCRQDLQISIQGVDPHGLFVANDCSLEFRTVDWDSTSHQMELNLTLATGLDFVLKGDASYIVHVQIQNDTSHPMWNYYHIPDLQVKSHDMPFHACIAFGDPHVLGMKLGLMMIFIPGDYLLYKARSHHDNLLQVQVRLWSPHRQGSSVCAAAVQYNEALIMVDMCTTRENMTAPVITQGEITLDDLRVYRCGAEYRILTGDGVHVTIHLYEHHMDLKLDLPPSYPSDVEGACNISAKHPPPHFASLAQYQLWNLQPNESLFNDAGLEFSAAKPQRESRAQRFCACRSASSCDMFSRLSDPLCTMTGNHLKCEGHCVIVTPHAVNPEHGAFTVEDPKSYGLPRMKWPNMITLKERNDICRSKIVKNLPMQCRSMVVLMNVMNQACTEDYKGSGGFTFADSAALAAIWSCESLSFNKMNNYLQLPDGSYHLKDQTALAYCADHCNGNGNCVGGRCACSPGFKGEACSIRIDAPPQILGIKGGNACEMSSLHCWSPILITRNVEENENLVTNITLIESILGKPVPSNTSLLVEPKYENKYSVSLQLSHVINLVHEKTAFGVRISLSNDGKLFSKEINYIIYDDACVYCSEKEGECLQKESTCHIDGQCFLNGESNPANASEVCNPGIGLVRWSEINAFNLPSSTTTSSPLLSPTTTSSPLLSPTTTSSPLLYPTTTSSPLLSPTTTSSPLLSPTTTSSPLLSPTTTSSPLLSPTMTSSPLLSPTTTNVPTTQDNFVVIG